MAKNFRHFLVLSLLLLSGDSHAMKRGYPDSSSSSSINNQYMETYFIPQDAKTVQDRLFSLLDNAQTKILIAMYWITEYSIIEKLITLKQNKEIDIQIIIDESSPKFEHIVIDKLLKNNIVPMIYPSKSVQRHGSMHDKFMVIDEALVFTGSANFTSTALNVLQSVSNHESISIIHSPEIAQKYQQTFMEIKNKILTNYVLMVANGNTPQWLLTLNYRLPAMRLHKIRESLWNNFDEKQRKRISLFFAVRFPTQNQKEFLKKYRSPEEIENLSFEEASELIGRMKRYKNVTHQ